MKIGGVGVHVDEHVESCFRFAERSLKSRINILLAKKIIFFEY